MLFRSPKARRRKYKGTSSPTPRLDRPVLAGAEQRSARLAQAIRAFDNALAPEHLSCAGAQPHRDAICSIAERLCELPDGERELTGAQEEDCEHARDACKTARARYRDRCGADD